MVPIEPCPEGAEDASIEHISFVEFDLMRPEQLEHFFLIVLLAMMFALVGDVSFHCILLRFAHGEHGVPFLPRKVRERSVTLVNPSR